MATLLIAAAALGSVFGRQREIAMFMMAGMVIGNVYAGWLVFREFEKGWAELLAALLPALRLAIPLAVVTWSACHFSSSLGTLPMAAVTVGSCTATYFLLLRQFYPDIINEFVLRFARPRMRTSASVLQH